MEKYLTRLLELNHRVIVPDLGAFIIRQQDPKELVFNDLLAFDDGMLAERLIQEENLSKSEAQNRIRQFVEKLKSVLQKGETYSLENLGSLQMDASGRISLLAASDEGDTAPEVPLPQPRKEEILPENTMQTAGAEESSKAEIPEARAEETETPMDEPEPARPGKAKPKAKPKTAKPKAVKSKSTGSKAAKPKTAKKKDTETGKDTKTTKAAELAKDVETEKGKVTEEGISEAPGPVIPVEKTGGKMEVDSGEQGTFELEEEDASVDSAGDDATRMEIVPDEPVPESPGTDGDEPPFQIDDSAEEIPEEKAEVDPEEKTEKKPEAESAEKADEIPDPFKGAVSDEESSEDGSMTIEELLESEQRKYKVQVDGVPVSMEADETPFRGYSPGKRRKAWPWIAGILVLIAAALLAGRLLFPEKLNRILPDSIAQRLFKEVPSSGTAMEETGEQEGTWETAVAEGQVGTEEQTGAGDEAEVAPTPGESVAPGEEAATPAAVIGPGAGSKKYYVVAGCFADIRNAENYVRLLRDQGYDASIFGKRDNLHAVCFSAHTTRQAAQEELSRIRSTYDASAWLLYY